MTVVLAILLALGVPFAQLQTVTDRVTCCCPDQEHCKCPDHKPDHSGQPSIRMCHKRAPVVEDAPPLAAFVAPELIGVVVPDPPVIQIEHRLVSPHAPPAPQRPDAPS